MKNVLFGLVILVMALAVVVVTANVGFAQTAGKLVINEVDYDQPSHDTAEFIEILNRSSATVDLSFYSLDLINGTGGGAKSYGKFQFPAVKLESGGYFVMCTAESDVENCDAPMLKSIQNGAPDAIVLKLNNTIVDVLSYEGNSGPYYEGDASKLKDPGTGGVDGPFVRVGLSRFPDGVDTNMNKSDFSLRCVTPGRANSEEAENCGAGQ